MLKREQNVSSVLTNQTARASSLGEGGGLSVAEHIRLFSSTANLSANSTWGTYLAKVGAERLGVCPQLVGRIAIQQSL